MRLSRALTLIELLLVMAIIMLVSTTGYYLSTNIRSRQALTNSVEALVVALRRAHVYSRESKDDRDWGIIRVNNNSYELMNRDGENVSEVEKYNLYEPIVFETGGFEIWFDQGSGETSNTFFVALRSPRGETRTAVVTKEGLVSIQ